MPSPEQPHARPVVVNIISVSYSGSTWLNLVLGSHPQAFSAGELTSIQRRGKPQCKLHGDACPVWSRFDSDSPQNLVDKIHQSSGKRWIIVNNPRYFQEELDRSDYANKFIHLVRDGRAVTASMLRKFADKTMWGAALQWTRSIRKHEAQLSRRPRADVIRVRYEDLVADPERGIGELCRFIGMPFDPAMLRYWEVEHCFLGGSRGTIFSLTKQRNAPEFTPAVRKNPDARFDKEFYEKASLERFVDERWKQELTPGQLRLFALIAGRQNRRLGYAAQ